MKLLSHLGRSLTTVHHVFEEFTVALGQQGTLLLDALAYFIGQLRQILQHVRFVVCLVAHVVQLLSLLVY